MDMLTFTLWYSLTFIITVSKCHNYSILGVFDFDTLPSDKRNISSESEINHFIKFVKRGFPALDNIAISYEELKLCENNSCISSTHRRNIDDIIKESMIIGIITNMRLENIKLLENITSYMKTEKTPVFVNGYKETELENVNKDFPLFFRVDHRMDGVTAIVKLTIKLRWTYVQVIYQESFKNISRSYKNQIEQYNICVLKEYVVNENTTDLEYRLLLDYVTMENTTKGVIVFMDEIRLRKLFEARNKTTTGNMFFISLTSNLSDNVTRDIENSILGTIAVETKSEEDKYVEDYLHQSRNTDDSHFILHSITTLILSLSTTIESRGSDGNQSVTETADAWIQEEVLHNIKKTRSTEMFNLQIKNETYSWIKIAEFDGTNMSTYDELVFYHHSGLMLTSVPQSYSDPYRPECRPDFYYPVVSDSADLYIVGVLPVHETGNTPDGSGRLKSNFAIISETIIFGIDKINRKQSRLSNLTLGYVIIDSCGLKDRVLFQLDKLFAGNLNPNLDKRIPQKIIGTVGFPEDQLYMEIAPYLASKQLVTISNYASSEMFSDKKKFPYFVRMSSSETTEVDVIISVLENLKLKQIGLIYSQSSYGISRAKLLLNGIEKNQDLSINYHVKFYEKYTKNDDVIDYLISTFLVNNLPSTKTIVTFLESRNLEAIMNRIKLSNNSEVLLISSEKYISEISFKTRAKIEKTFTNAIFIGPSSTPCPEFQNHLKSVSGHGIPNNHYLAEYLKYNGDDTHTPDLDLNDTHFGVSLTIDSVSALAIGIEKLIASSCISQEFCYKAKQNLDKLPEHIQSQTFTGSCGNKVQFDSKSDAIHDLKVMQLRGHALHEIGIWNNGILHMKSPVSVSKNLSKPCISNRCFKPPNDILDMKYIYEYGDAMMYGFFEIHSKNPSGGCSDSINEKGFQMMNSMLWSIREINKADDLLPNTTLGVALFDTCGSSERTEGLVRSVLMPSFVLSQNNFIPREHIVLGVIGGDTDTTAINLEKGTRMMNRHIPLIITSHTSILNDKKLHPRLYRTVVTDTVEIDFLLQLLVQFNWTYVHVIFDSKTHGTFDYFEQHGRKLGICLATKSVSKNPDHTVFLNLAFDNITKIADAPVLVIIAETKTIRRALTIARDRGLSGKLHWVVPNDAGNIQDIYRGLEDVALGLMTVKNKVKVNKSFMKEYANLNLTNNKSLPWLPEFLEMTYKCNLRFSNKYDKSCRSDMTINSTNQDFRTEASINAVYSLATAFDTVLKGCNGLVKECFEKYRTDFYSRIEKLLDDVKAFPKGGNPFIFKNRNATTSFSILNLQRSPNGKVRFLEVGSYSNGNLQIDFRKLVLNRGRQQAIPLSHCAGHCLQCMDAKFLSNYSDRVNMLYLKGPPANHNFGSAMGLIIILLNFTCAVLVVIIIYYLNNNTRHKAISLVLDANIFLLFSSVIVTLSSIAFLFDTSEVTCLIQRSIPGCVLTVPIGCLLIKLNKAVCLRNIVGFKQIQVPRWDFSLTFLPIMMTSPIIVYICLVVNDHSSVSWSVKDVHEVNKIEDIEISWTCKINREGFLMLFAITWQLLLEAIVLTTNYRIRNSTQPEVKEVTRSLVVITTVILIWSCVLFITENYKTFSTLVCLMLPFVGILLIFINFLPFILVLIHEEKQTMAFSDVVWKGKSENIFNRWRGTGSKGTHKVERNKSSGADLKITEIPSNPSQNVSAKRAFTKWKGKDASVADLKMTEIPSNPSQNVSAKQAFTKWKGKDGKPRDSVDTNIELSERS